MNVAGIIILIVGAVIFTVSFFVPDGKNNTKKSKEIEEKLVHEAVEHEITKYKYKMEEIADDTIESAKQTVERYYDRITNEKMMAISEYSDTVMEQIHKNHEEAVFLYDMLNNKHSQVKNTTVELNQLAKSIRNIPKERLEKQEEQKVSEEQKEIEKSEFEPIKPEHIILSNEQKQGISKAKEPTKKKEKTKNTSNTRNNKIEVMFDSDSNGMNSNDRILSLHKEGKSNMAIAKELGLGIGEVKLVIDLFEGI